MIAPLNDSDVDNENEVPPHIEPIFWGTSDLLQWELSKLLEQLKRIPNTSKKDARDLTMDDLNGIPVVAEIDARGIYGYFPVITEHDSIVIIDPSDFHSELTVIRLSSKWEKLQKTLNPDGDIIAFAAVTLGPQFARSVESSVQHQEKELLSSIGNDFISILSEKTNVEIRRGMGISEKNGNAFSVPDVVSDPTTELSPLYEMMGLEERLAVLHETGGKIIPDFSFFSIFFPRFFEDRTKM